MRLTPFSKRPLSVTLVGWLYIATGIMGLVYHAGEFRPEHPFDSDLLLAMLVRLFAVVCGAYLLRGSNWARWGAIAWIGFHVILSIFHTPFELAMHVVLCGVICYLLLQNRAAGYFRAAE